MLGPIQKMFKKQAPPVKQARQARLEHYMREADDAASRHDLFNLYRTVHAFCHKARKSRTQLRLENCHLASPYEKFEQLC